MPAQMQGAADLAACTPQTAPACTPTAEELCAQLADCRKRLAAVLALLRHITGFGIDGAEVSDFMADELAQALLADSCIFYLVADRGFIPFGVSKGLESVVDDFAAASTGGTASDAHKSGRNAFSHSPASPGVPPIVSRARDIVCFDVLEAPALAGDFCLMRDSSGMRHKARSILAASCASLVGVPVFSGDRVAGVLVFGWHAAHALDEEDRAILQSISETLSFGISSAFSQVRLTHSNDLKDALIAIHDTVSQCDMECRSVALEVAEVVACSMPARVMLVSAREDGEGCVIVPLEPGHEVGEPLQTNMAFDEVVGVDGAIRAIQQNSELGMWVGRHTDLNSGFVVPIAARPLCGDGRYALLVLRGMFDVPFDFLDEEFLRDVSQEIARIVSTERLHASEAQIAHALQVGLRNEMPQVNGISTASLYVSATEAAVVGGDFFDLHQLDDNRFVVVMGDVSGKGVEAAVVASMAKTGLAAYAWDKSEPDEMVDALNGLFLSFSRVETFASMCVVTVDLVSQSAKYCSAGHPPAMLVHGPDTANPSLELLTTQSPVVGAFEGMRYISGSFKFDLGDVLFLYTDGTTEARSPSGGFFGEANLRDALLRACRFGLDDIPRRVLKEVEDFTGGETHDDIAMVAVRFDGLY